MKISEFMSLCLRSEGGYYQIKEAIGKKADFITAPEISQIFGEVIGYFLLSYIKKNNNFSNFDLVELGPGRGVLFYDILTILSRSCKEYEKLTLILVEVNQTLVNVQKQKLKNHQVKWFNNYHLIQSTSPRLIVANEFLDAMLVDQYKKTKDGWCSVIIVESSGNQYQFAEQEIFDANLLNKLDAKYPGIPTGSIVEISEESVNLIKKIAKHLTKHKGVAIFIDYGYFKSRVMRYESTLQGVSKHQYIDVLTNVKAVDVSCHVDFEELAMQAASQGCVVNLMTQAEFLNAYGAELILQKLLKKAQSQKQKDELISGYNRLTSKKEMGDLFKVMIITNE